MPRDIPVGNGQMLVTFDELYRVRDIFYPHVGLPNHTGGLVQRFGVWADGQFAWIEDSGWSRSLRYKPETMITEVVLRHPRLGVELNCNDAVDYGSPIFLRKITVTDLIGKARDVRIFFHHDLSINGSPVGDTVNYAIGHYLGPKVFHYPKSRFFNPDHLRKTHDFYEKYGGKTIIIARFVPIVRTFAPFVAGIGAMSYPRFITYNVVGGLLWVAVCLGAGFLFGNLPFVKKNFSLVILAIIVVSVMPAVVEYWRNRSQAKPTAAA